MRRILLGDARCRECQALVGVNRAVAAVSSLLILIVTIVTTLIVYFQMGQWWALLWFTAPVGALSYVKAKFAPLQVRSKSV